MKASLFSPLGDNLAEHDALEGKLSYSLIFLEGTAPLSFGFPVGVEKLGLCGFLVPQMASILTVRGVVCL